MYIIVSPYKQVVVSFLEANTTASSVLSRVVEDTLQDNVLEYIKKIEWTTMEGCNRKECLKTRKNKTWMRICWSMMRWWIWVRRICWRWRRVCSRRICWLILGWWIWIRWVCWWVNWVCWWVRWVWIRRSRWIRGMWRWISCWCGRIGRRWRWWVGWGRVHMRNRSRRRRGIHRYLRVRWCSIRWSGRSTACIWFLQWSKISVHYSLLPW